jgi:hypothetical protein
LTPAEVPVVTLSYDLHTDIFIQLVNGSTFAAFPLVELAYTEQDTMPIPSWNPYICEELPEESLSCIEHAVTLLHEAKQLNIEESPEVWLSLISEATIFSHK